ncbi:hypothetical protein [Synechococcus phage MA01]
MMNDRNGTYQAMWFLKKDLKDEKMNLLEDMREISLNNTGGIMDELMKEVTDRIEEINQILLKVDTGFYKLEE